MVESHSALFDLVENLPQIFIPSEFLVQQVIEIDSQLQQEPQSKLCLMANQLGTLALAAKSYERATSLLNKALAISQSFTQQLPYSHLLYNLGNLYLA